MCFLLRWKCCLGVTLADVQLWTRTLLRQRHNSDTIWQLSSSLMVLSHAKNITWSAAYSWSLTESIRSRVPDPVMVFCGHQLRAKYQNCSCSHVYYASFNSASKAILGYAVGLYKLFFVNRNIAFVNMKTSSPANGDDIFNLASLMLSIIRLLVLSEDVRVPPVDISHSIACSLLWFHFHH